MLDLTRDRTVRTSGLLLLAAVPATSCQGLEIPEPSGVFADRTESRGPNRLAEVQPGDIAILPLRNQTKEEELPLAALRGALHDELVTRLYSPLDLGYVDAHWADASYMGQDPPDAVLQVSINHWSTSDVVGHGILEIGAELRLFQGGSTAGTPLWSAQIDRRVRVITGNPPFGPVPPLIDEGIRIYAREAAQAIPERDPVAAPRQG